MATRSIKKIVGLQRAWNAVNRRAARLYRQPYVLQPALRRHLDQFEDLKRIGDNAARFQAFRRVPSLEYELRNVDAGLTPRQRESLAQQDRAKRPRVRLTADGETLETIISKILIGFEDPWRHKAKEYWHLMIERLRKFDLNPTPMIDPADPSNERLEYDSGGRRRSLRLGQFENIVSKVRRRLDGGRN